MTKIYMKDIKNLFERLLLDDWSIVYNISIYSTSCIYIQVLYLDYSIIYCIVYYYMFIMLVITLNV